MSPAIITRPSWYYYARAEEARAVYIKSSNLRATEEREKNVANARNAKPKITRTLLLLVLARVKL
jgi:hypothetical protein